MDDVWTILVVDDDDEVCDNVAEALRRAPIGVPAKQVKVVRAGNPAEAAVHLGSTRIDLAIVDVFLEGDVGKSVESGRLLLDALKRERFVPVVFHTALPGLVSDLTSVAVRVVDKASGTRRLVSVLNEVFETRLPALVHHLEDVQRKFVWEELPGLWPATEAGNAIEPAYLLARRLSRTLSGPPVKNFLGMDGQDAHPIEFYVVPPVPDEWLTGDLFRDKRGGYSILLTPSCDLVGSPTRARKADTVLLVHGDPLATADEFHAWRKTCSASQSRGSRATKRELSCLVRNVRKKQPGRYHFLPGFLAVPDLVLDFQKTRTCAFKELAHHERIASLDNPFAEHLQNRFMHYFGRVGAPDINVNVVEDRLLSMVGDKKTRPPRKSRKK